MGIIVLSADPPPPPRRMGRVLSARRRARVGKSQEVAKGLDPTERDGVAGDVVDLARADLVAILEGGPTAAAERRDTNCPNGYLHLDGSPNP